MTAAVDECATGATAEAIQLFNNWWTDICHNTYITSIQNITNMRISTGGCQCGALLVELMVASHSFFAKNANGD